MYECKPSLIHCEFCEHRTATITIRVRKNTRAACDECAFWAIS